MTTDDQTRAGLMQQVIERLAEARRVWRIVDVGGAVLRSVTFLLLLFLVGIVADNLLALPRIARLSMSVFYVGATVYFIIVHVVLRMVRPLTDEMVASHIERAYPGLDNCLINAVQLSREKITDPITHEMVSAQLGETARAVRDCDVSASTDRGRLLRWGVWAAVLLALTVVYAVLFSRHFANAVQRYAAPQKTIPPITDTRLTVVPGDAEKLQGEPLTVEANIDGVLPESASIYFDDAQGATSHRAMSFEGSLFVHHFRSLQQGFTYWVKAGDATSEKFKVTVHTRPTVQGIKITYTFPEYMGLASATDVSRTGAVRAPVGATAHVEAAADRELAEATLAIRYLIPGEAPGEPDSEQFAMDLNKPQLAAADLQVKRNGEYRIMITDTAGIPNLPLSRTVTALPDEAPVVRVVEPGKDLAVPPGAKVPLLAEARDDFAVRGMALLVQRRAGEEAEPVRTWDYSGAKTEITEGAVLDLGELDARPGEKLSYYFQANDGKPGRDPAAGRSRVYQITVLDQNVAQEEQDRQRDALRNIVRRLIAQQKANLAATDGVRRWPPGKELDAAFTTAAARLVAAQEMICSDARRAVQDHAASAETDMVEALADIAAREMPQAVDLLAALRDCDNAAAIDSNAAPAAEMQSAIIALLNRLLVDPRALLAERLEEQGLKEELDEEIEDMTSSHEMARKMLEKVKEFQDDQREAIALSKQLAEIPVDDFTEGDEKTLEDIIEMEMKWAKYFQQTATDLSKLPPQDYSLSGMADEHLEVYTELKKAADAAGMKAMEIATPLEDGAADTAKSIEENIEKWLAESADHERWKMEDPIADLDVPLAELPDELEDIIGDLLDEEGDLLDEAEDATSGWLGSADKGIGWDAMDGPISNMTAKGVTGNRLPNDMEVGGRSGEGRTGKSRGQHVEKTATGKGGRKTPTRLTPDPFEAGAVEDTSAEPPTGSTGGGKVSGDGAEGLQGPIPPALQDKLKRLALQQQQLIDQARRLDFGLKKYRYPRGRLPDTIEIMENIQGELTAGSYISTAGRRNKTVLSGLREIKELVEKQKDVRRDRSALLPKEMRDEISASLQDETPRQYRDMVNDYFRALAEGGSSQ